MQVYTGMVDALDFHVGRLIDYLREVDEFDNTLIVVISDNGPSGGDRFDLGNNERWIPANFDNWHENMGRRGSYIAYGAQWAQVSSTSYRMYKTFTAEGGIVAPAIISFPAELARNRVSHQSASILDVVPTLLQVANLDVQDNS